MQTIEQLQKGYKRKLTEQEIEYLKQGLTRNGTKKRIREPKPKREIKLLEPKQALFKSYYTDPKSQTFGNAYQSAIKAGYSENYATNILWSNQKWIMEIVEDERRLKKAERNLEEVQNLPIKTVIENKETGETKEIINVDVINQKVKVDMFLAERLNKQKYSTRQEHAVIQKIEHNLSQETIDKLRKMLKKE